MTYDPYEPVEDTLMRSYRRFLRRRAVSRITWAFGTEKWWGFRYETALTGLARVVRGARRGVLSSRPAAPWGWRARKIEHRDAYEIMPLWLYWLVVAWERRYEWTLGTLERLGLWKVREGDLWTSGRLTAPRWLRAFVWCFLNDRDRYDLRVWSVAWPSDIVVRYNTLSRPSQWRVKNIFERKEARPLLVDLPPYWGDEIVYEVEYRIKSVPPAPRPW